MPKIETNQICMEYEDRGKSNDPVILLISGLGQQMTAWPDALADMLVDSGFRVIRYDNRDTGRSTWIDNPRFITPDALAVRQRLPHLPVLYTLNDMADDALGLMDALDIEVSHLVGASMGGMIAQILASRAHQRVLTLTSMMSSSGRPGLPGPTPELQARLLAPSPEVATYAQLLVRAAETLRIISYPDPERHDPDFKNTVELAAERGYNPRGVSRQLLAIHADGSRVERLAKITAPTLVIHGAADPLIPPPCGIDTARSIHNARLEIIEQIAHDFPPSQLRRIASLLTAQAKMR